MFGEFLQNKLKILVCAVFVLIMTIGIFYYSQACADGVLEGINFCVTLLVPSLFPFMVLSAFIANSGIAQLFEPLLNPIMRLFFGLPGICGAVFFLSMTGGYPIGARGISSMVEGGLITQKDAEKMAYFCVCAGPGFLITFVGAGLYGSRAIGFALYLSQLISAVFLGILCKIVFGIKAKGKTKAQSTATKHKIKFKQHLLQVFKPAKQISNKEQKPVVSFINALVSATNSGTKSAIIMCGMVIMFSAATAIGDAFFKGNQIEHGIFLNLMEVTAACHDLSKTAPLELIAFVIGWGGLCVHFQIFSFLGKVKINKLIFVAMRALQGGITALAAHIIVPLFPIYKQVFYSTVNGTSPAFYNNNYIASTGLILTALCLVMFLFNFKKTNKLH
ncbi:MAG: hypothetical protein LBM65_01760 [Oscillospiraceae bacterium]|nr:hypothetical protein [Oscillospiraceae bacterium]